MGGNTRTCGSGTKHQKNGMNHIQQIQNRHDNKINTEGKYT